MHSLTTELTLPIPLEEAWAFFSNPRNLSRIKPPDMLFKILTELPSGIYPGLIIHYRVAPVYRIPFYWTTEITQSEPLRYFMTNNVPAPSSSGIMSITFETTGRERHL